MPIYISESSGGGNFDKKPLEAGAYAGVCDMVIDLGVQASPNSQYPAKRTVLLRFQIPSERVEITKDGETKDLPAVISRTLSLSLNEKATLRQLLQSWRGRAFTPDELKRFDLTAVLGKPAFVNITHSVKGDRTYANLTSLMPLPKGMPAPELEGEALWYSIDEPDASVFDKLPAWIQDKIATRVIDQPVAAKPAAAPAQVDTWAKSGPKGPTKPKIDENVEFQPDDLDAVAF